MLESKIQSDIIKALKNAGIYCVRVVHASKRGKHDLLCCSPILITKDMVGLKVGVFCSLEIKKNDGGDESDLQKYNCLVVEKSGGNSGFARSVEEALKICKKKPIKL